MQQCVINFTPLGYWLMLIIVGWVMCNAVHNSCGTIHSFPTATMYLSVFLNSITLCEREVERQRERERIWIVAPFSFHAMGGFCFNAESCLMRCTEPKWNSVTQCTAVDLTCVANYRTVGRFGFPVHDFIWFLYRSTRYWFVQLC